MGQRGLYHRVSCGFYLFNLVIGPFFVKFAPNEKGEVF